MLNRKVTTHQRNGAATKNLVGHRRDQERARLNLVRGEGRISDDPEVGVERTGTRLDKLHSTSCTTDRRVKGFGRTCGHIDGQRAGVEREGRRVVEARINFEVAYGRTRSDRQGDGGAELRRKGRVREAGSAWADQG